MLIYVSWSINNCGALLRSYYVPGYSPRVQHILALVIFMSILDKGLPWLPAPCLLICKLRDSHNSGYTEL